MSKKVQEMKQNRASSLAYLNEETYQEFSFFGSPRVCSVRTLAYQTPAVVSHDALTPVRLIPLSHRFDVLMESFSLLLAHCTKIVRKIIHMAMQEVYFHSHIPPKHLESLRQVTHQESVILSFRIAKKIGHHHYKCIPCIQFCWLHCTEEDWIWGPSNTPALIFSLWWWEVWHTGTWNSLLSCPVPLQIASSSQVWCAVAGEELSLVSPVVHTWYFSHQQQIQFVWASLVSPISPFLHGCSTSKENRDTSWILLVDLEAYTQSSNFDNFSSCALSILTSKALVSCCHRILSFKPSDLSGWRQIRFHCAVEHTSNLFWSYQWKVSIRLTHTNSPKQLHPPF